MKLRLPLELDRSSKGPIQRQLTEKFKQAILELTLMPGQLLPSTRELEKMLGISRATAVRVYNDLIAQGFIETVEGKGTFVRKRLSSMPLEPASSEFNLSEQARHVMQLQPARMVIHDFAEMNYGCAPAEFLPIAQWKQALLDSCRDFDPSLIDYGHEPFGFLPLREAICGYLSRSRMLNVPVERLIVIASSTYPEVAVAELLVDRGDSIAFGDPGGLYARDTFNSLGANLIYIDVDEEGLDVSQIFSLPTPPKIVYVNSSHHDPTGAPLSMERRKALLEWAETNSVIIIEDDYDSEYRYAGSRMPPLRAMSKKDNVVYISGFWRTLYPLVNVAFMVAPAPLVPVLSRSWDLTYYAFHTHFCFMDQLALARLLNSGDYEKHLHKTQPIYANRWRVLVQELVRNFGSKIRVVPESSSVHLFVEFSLDIPDEELISRAQEVGLPLLSAARHYASRSARGAFLLPVTHLSEEQIVAKVGAFKQRLF